MNNCPNPMSKQTLQLRKNLRTQRRQLSTFQQRHSEQAAFNQLRKSSQFRTAKKVGIYLDGFGELRTHKIIEYCFQQHKQVYLPIICNMNKILVWVKTSKYQYRNKRFVMHKLGMLEPMCNRGLHVSHLDILLMPLLACDQVGTRMGMGGGFYDRTLASAPYQPYRLGLAHDFQLLNTKLHRNPWDQALDALITPTKYTCFKRQLSQSHIL